MIQYKLIIESIGEMVRDRVLNKWDMDPQTTNAFETKGTLVFEVKPKSDPDPEVIRLDTSTTTYEEVP
ncbi:MAG: hypothetical protein ABFS18_14240 [Thermodesulfobacteriota bacterium]